MFCISVCSSIFEGFVATCYLLIFDIPSRHLKHFAGTIACHCLDIGVGDMCLCPFIHDSLCICKDKARLQRDILVNGFWNENLKIAILYLNTGIYTIYCRCCIGHLVTIVWLDDVGWNENLILFSGHIQSCKIVG